MSDTTDQSPPPFGMSAAVRTWGSIVISVMIVGGFMLMGWIVLTRAAPTGSETAAAIVLGNVGAFAAQVANYWLGSSAGSASKDAAKK